MINAAIETVTGAKTFTSLGTFNAGLTVVGPINLNNNATTNITNIGTGSTTGAVTIGGSGNSIVLPKFNANGVVINNSSGELSSVAGNNGVLVTDGSGVPSISSKVQETNLPSGSMLLIYANESNTSGTSSSSGERSYSLSANTYSYIVVEAEVSLVHSGGNDSDFLFDLKFGAVTKETTSLRAKGINAGDAHDFVGVLKYSEAFTAGGNISLDVNVITANGTWYVKGFRIYGVI